MTKDFDWSEKENNKLLFGMAAKYGIPYFSNYVNSDMKPSDIRSMAILASQEVIFRNRDGRITTDEIRHLVGNWLKQPDNNKPHYEMLMNGTFVPIIDMFEVPYEDYPTYVELTTEFGVKQSFSYDHRCPVIRNGEYAEVMSQDVLPGDKLILARHAYNDDGSGIGTYETGRMVGMYLAEGWVAHGGYEIVYAINEHRTDLTEEIKDYFEPLGCRVQLIHDENGHIYKVKVFGKMATGLVTQFVAGDKATKKRLTNHVFDTSADFRRGLYDGYLTTDGSPSNKILAHTTNRELCKDLITLGATIGRYAKYSEDTHNTRYFKPDKSDLEHFTSYKLNIVEPEIWNDDFYLVGVASVKQLPSHATKVYNFTVDTKEHLYTLPNGIVTHQCCRLRLSLRELRRRNGGFFGAGESTGSVGVVTLNLPKLAYESSDEAGFYARLDHYMDLAARSLKTKREVLTKLLDAGLYPYTKAYLGTFNNHFSTIGLVGMNEAGLNANWIRADMTDKKTQDFAVRTLNHMRERLKDYQEQYGDLYNLEATPAESTAYRFAKHDKEQYPDIVTANPSGTPYYTNSSHLPVGYSEDIFSALDIQDPLQVLYTSGTVFHAFLGERLPDWRSAMSLVRKIAENYRLPYYTLSPTYSVCKNHGYLAGEQPVCPFCGEKTEVYSRITGYYRAVQNWNDGKQQEFKDRKTYVPGSSVLTHEGPLTPAATTAPPAFSVTRKLPVLVTTHTCPNCPQVREFLNANRIAYTENFADDDPSFALEHGIDITPTLVMPDGRQLTGAGPIRGEFAAK